MKTAKEVLYLYLPYLALVCRLLFQFCCIYVVLVMVSLLLQSESGSGYSSFVFDPLEICSLFRLDHHFSFFDWIILIAFS